MKKLGLKIKLLSLLDDLPDNAVRLDVLFQEYEARYKNEMLPSDFEIDPSGAVRWRHSLQGKITECRSKGLLSSPARGYWQITDNGRRWLRENQRSYNYDWRTWAERNQLLNIAGMDLIKHTAIKEEDGLMLQTFGDFFVPLMKILEGLPNRAGQTGEVLRIFEETYREQIDPVLYTQNQSGHVRWEYNVRWSREKLKLIGFLDSPQRGVWHLTEKGQQWLEDHPAATHLTAEKSKSSRRVKTVSFAPPQKGMETASEFLTALQDGLQDSLKEIFGPFHYEFTPRANYLRIRVTGFAGCHYDITLRHRKHEIALHFESSAERSQARLRGFEPHIQALSQKLGMPVHAGDFGSRGWTQVYIETRPMPLTESLVKEYTALVERFVAATFPILKTVYAGERTAHTAGSHLEKFAPNHPIYAILDQEVANIRLYLEGRSLLPISDEKLCDWINFCYIFGMYSEGRELFSLVNGVEVNAWYFERTKRIAKACEQKMHLFDLRNT